MLDSVHGPVQLQRDRAERLADQPAEECRGHRLCKPDITAKGRRQAGNRFCGQAGRRGARARAGGARPHKGACCLRGLRLLPTAAKCAMAKVSAVDPH